MRNSEKPRRLCRSRECKSEFCSDGFKGQNADARKILLVAHMMNKRVLERDLLGVLGHYHAFVHSDSGKAIMNILSHECLGLTLENVYFTNIFKGFVGDRNPTREEYRACLKQFEKQVREFNPKSIIAMGEKAYELMFPREGEFKYNVSREFLYDNNGKQIPCLVTYHPSRLFRMQIHYRVRIADFIKSSL